MNIRTRRFTLVAVAGACLAALISFALGFGRSVWFDEGYTIIVLDQPFDRMMALLKVDVHPPLYYLLLRGWTGIFGSSVTAMRAMSCLFCGLTVVAMMASLRRLAGERAALMTMPFLVAAPMLLRYGYEIRMYSLVPFLSALGTYMLLRAVEAERASGNHDPKLRGSASISGKRWWLAYAIVVVLGMYTQYMMALVWLTHLIWLCLRARHVGRFAALRRYLAPYLLAVMFYLPWLPSAIDQITHNALPALKGTLNLNELGSVFSVLVTGLNGSRLPSCVTVVLVAMLALIITRAIQLHDAWRLRQDDDTRAARDALGTLAFLAFTPMVMLLLISAIREPFTHPYGFFTMRYVTPFTPYCYAFIGLTCSYTVIEYVPGRPQVERRAYARFICRWSAWLLTVALLAGGAIGYAFQGNYIYEQATTPSTAQVAEQVACDADQTIVAASEFDYIESYYYFRSCSRYRFLKRGNVDTRGGYAPLHGSTAQLRNLDDLDTKRVVIVNRMNFSQPKTSRYRKIRTLHVGSSTMTFYEKIGSAAD
ncbi:glycosyltransferase family 39 protein [Bifidobacterium sp. 64T4]|uniref:glycosyltransferase family 39 protein n=1 Tax=Bifidobacterium pongonis TaxID=2834432 RepID=UPI001C55C320|nr:glycosyltransferase family 39 protein [Bifidobacterium pongonis]MBW3094203.1 glycosyltransferase family 39 protein [Bifidobacterium pongonis]